MLMKLLQDFEDLERFYSDKDYRNNLISQARYPSLEYVQLQNIYEQDSKLKEKLNLSEGLCKVKEKAIGFFLVFYI
jgi:hypothetical protein